MIGKCITCKIEIEIIGGTRYCEPCKKVKNSTRWKIYNEQRSDTDKTKYHCSICRKSFFAQAKRKHNICNKIKCHNHFYSLRKLVQVLPQRIITAQHKLVAAKSELQIILGEQS